MGREPNADQVMAALRESGYLMEQEVATELEMLHFHVQTNAAFEDPDEAKSREIDVRAVKRAANNENAKLSAFVELIVECKNSSNPFVFITRPKNSVDMRTAPSRFVYPAKFEMKQDLGSGRSRSREKEAFFHLGFDTVHPEYSLDWKAVQFCRIDRKSGGWHANHGGLYDAIFYPLAKAVTARWNDIPKNQRPDEWRYFWFLLPVVVTAGELLVVHSHEAVPTPVSVQTVHFKRELRSGKIAGVYGIDFVRQSHLQAFMREHVDRLAARASEFVTDNVRMLLETSLPWEEP